MRHHNSDLLLHYFVRGEFGPTPQRAMDWWEMMDPAVLVRLDVFRNMWNDSFMVSPHGRALGRLDNVSNTSDHNVEKRGRVQCVDGFPAGMTTQKDAEKAKELARQCGFSSIGLYPHWRPSPGLHLGIRLGAGGRNPMAEWGAVRTPDGKQKFVSWEEALRQLPKGET